MLSVAEAQHAILKLVTRAKSMRLPVTGAQGLALAGDITSTIDSPPYDKALMDGFAVLAADLEAAAREGAECSLIVQEEIMAGHVPRLPLAVGCAARIMTGAPLPEGTDAVVMLEESEPGPQRKGMPTVQLRPAAFRAGQNLLRRGAAMKRGETVLSAGQTLTPAAIGLLAELGMADVAIIAPPQVAILSTGDELVPFAAEPGAGQLRNSNGPMLAAQIRDTLAAPQELGIARDNEDELRSAIEHGLQSDILLLSGGVSAGDLDLVPGVLKSLGVRQVFHKVHLKPGKPLWFGVLESTEDNAAAETLVFGLPGNPVSSFVCFELFVRPAIRKLMGRAHVHRGTRMLPLAAAHTHRGGRPVYLPAKIETTEAGACVHLLAWQGSADLRRLAEANALAQLPAEAGTYAVGDLVTVMPLTAE
jgi:molybdopterin molybdotransferase